MYRVTSKEYTGKLSRRTNQPTSFGLVCSSRFWCLLAARARSKNEKNKQPKRSEAIGFTDDCE